MEKLWLWLLCLPCFLWCDAPYSIVCVHVGQKLPAYVHIALDQARLFNKDCSIILIANEHALEDFSSHSNIITISCESLPLTPEHKMFQNRTKLKEQVLNGYLRYTSERFLYLYDYMAAFGAQNVFHIENDVLLYVDLGTLLPVFQKYYPGIATTFESVSKCIPGFIFIAHANAMQKLANYFAIKASKAMMDMKLIALYWKERPNDIDCLPMIMNSYLVENTPPGYENRYLKKLQRHSKYIEQFGSIFDGAAIGVFFDGLALANGDFFPPGYLMKKLFDPLLLEYTWEIDEQGRRIPYARYKDEIFRINNLHIASKRLELFTSKEALVLGMNQLFFCRRLQGWAVH